ncbi:HxsD-like protein (plasmid) [Haloimpatiens sp. FM7330]|uniref:HxsD-like protein n=1 Tax=Haloimpatiens sp. FM7330 TaxID=3298610 RepID=UPI00363C579A
MDNLQLNTYIYPLKFINKAIEDYSQFIDKNSSLITEKNTSIVFNCNTEEINLLKNEFCNYLIYLIGRDY